MKKPKRKSTPGHADPEEYQRFLEMAREVEASDDPAEFDKAFARVTREGSRPRRTEQPESS